MIADDKVDAQLLGVGNLFEGLDAAVENDDQFDTLFCSIFQSLDTDTIPLVIAGWDVIFNIGIVLL